MRPWIDSLDLDAACYQRAQLLTFYSTWNSLQTMHNARSLYAACLCWKYCFCFQPPYLLCQILSIVSHVLHRPRPFKLSCMVYLEHLLRNAFEVVAITYKLHVFVLSSFGNLESTAVMHKCTTQRAVTRLLASLKRCYVFTKFVDTSISFSKQSHVPI